MSSEMVMAGSPNRSSQNFSMIYFDHQLLFAYGTEDRVVIADDFFQAFYIMKDHKSDVLSVRWNYKKTYLATISKEKVVIYYPKHLVETSSYDFVKLREFEIDGIYPEYQTFLEWIGDTTILVANKDIRLFEFDEETMTYTKADCVFPHRGKLEFLDTRPEKELIATVCEDSYLVKVWFRRPDIAPSDSKYAFSFVYLRHPYIVSSINWRKTRFSKKEGKQGVVIMTCCIDGSIRFWTRGKSIMFTMCCVIVNESVLFQMPNVSTQKRKAETRIKTRWLEETPKTHADFYYSKSEVSFIQNEIRSEPEEVEVDFVVTKNIAKRKITVYEVLNLSSTSITTWRILDSLHLKDDPEKLNFSSFVYFYGPTGVRFPHVISVQGHIRYKQFVNYSIEMKEKKMDLLVNTSAHSSKIVDIVCHHTLPFIASIAKNREVILWRIETTPLRDSSERIRYLLYLKQRFVAVIWMPFDPIFFATDGEDVYAYWLQSVDYVKGGAQANLLSIGNFKSNSGILKNLLVLSWKISPEKQLLNCILLGAGKNHMTIWNVVLTKDRFELKCSATEINTESTGDREISSIALVPHIKPFFLVGYSDGIVILYLIDKNGIPVELATISTGKNPVLALASWGVSVFAATTRNGSGYKTIILESQSAFGKFLIEDIINLKSPNSESGADLSTEEPENVFLDKFNRNNGMNILSIGYGNTISLFSPMRLHFDTPTLWKRAVSDVKLDTNISAMSITCIGDYVVGEGRSIRMLVGNRSHRYESKISGMFSTLSPIPDSHPFIIGEHLRDGDYDSAYRTLKHLKEVLVRRRREPRERWYTHMEFKDVFVKPEDFSVLPSPLLPTELYRKQEDMRGERYKELWESFPEPEDPGSPRFMKYRMDEDDVEMLLEDSSMELEEKHDLIAVSKALKDVRHLGGGMDRAARQFIISYFTDKYRVPPRKEINFSEYIWPVLSESQQPILDICVPESPTWEDVRRLGVGYWLKDINVRILLAERIARAEYLAKKDPDDAALFYFALKKINTMLRLYKMAGRSKFVSFLSHDFTEARWTSAAKKNAFVLLSKRSYKLAAAFFILGESVDSAISVLTEKLGDWQLALFICGICCENERKGRSRGSESPYGRMLEIYANQEGKVESRDFWLKVIANLQLGRKEVAIDILKPMQYDEGVLQQHPLNHLRAYSYMLVLYKHITDPQDLPLDIHSLCSHIYLSVGSPIMALEQLRKRQKPFRGTNEQISMKEMIQNAVKLLLSQYLEDIPANESFSYIKKLWERNVDIIVNRYGVKRTQFIPSLLRFCRVKNLVKAECLILSKNKDKVRDTLLEISMSVFQILAIICNYPMDEKEARHMFKIGVELFDVYRYYFGEDEEPMIVAGIHTIIFISMMYQQRLADIFVIIKNKPKLGYAFSSSFKILIGRGSAVSGLHEEDVSVNEEESDSDDDSDSDSEGGSSSESEADSEISEISDIDKNDQASEISDDENITSQISELALEGDELESETLNFDMMGKRVDRCCDKLKCVHWERIVILTLRYFYIGLLEYMKSAIVKRDSTLDDMMKAAAPTEPAEEKTNDRKYNGGSISEIPALKLNDQAPSTISLHKMDAQMPIVEFINPTSLLNRLLKSDLVSGRRNLNVRLPGEGKDDMRNLESMHPEFRPGYRPVTPMRLLNLLQPIEHLSGGSTPLGGVSRGRTFSYADRNPYYEDPAETNTPFLDDNDGDEMRITFKGRSKSIAGQSLPEKVGYMGKETVGLLDPQEMMLNHAAKNFVLFMSHLMENLTQLTHTESKTGSLFDRLIKETNSHFEGKKLLEQLWGKVSSPKDSMEILNSTVGHKEIEYSEDRFYDPDIIYTTPNCLYSVCMSQSGTIALAAVKEIRELNIGDNQEIESDLVRSFPATWLEKHPVEDCLYVAGGRDNRTSLFTFGSHGVFQSYDEGSTKTMLDNYTGVKTERFISKIRFSPTGAKFISSTRQGRFLIYRTREPPLPMHEIDIGATRAYDAIFMNSSSVIVTCSNTSHISIIDTMLPTSSRVISKLKFPNELAALSVIHNNSRQEIVAGLKKTGKLAIVDLRMMKLRKTVDAHTRAVRTLSMLETNLVSGSTDGNMKLWDANNDYKVIQEWESAHIPKRVIDPSPATPWISTHGVTCIRSYPTCVFSVGGDGLLIRRKRKPAQ